MGFMRLPSLNLPLFYFFIKKFKNRYALVFVLTAALAIIESLTVVALYQSIHYLFDLEEPSGGGAAKIVFFVGKLIHYLPFSNILLSSFFLLLLVLLIRCMLSIAREAMAAKASGDVMYFIKNDLFAQHASFPYQFFIQEKQGNILYTITNAPNRVAGGLLGFSQLAAELSKIAFLLIALFYINFTLTLITAAAMAGYYVLTDPIVKKRAYISGKERIVTFSEISSVVNEFCNGFRQISAFGAKPHWRTRFDMPNRRFTHFYVDNLVWIAITKNFLLLVGTAVLVGFAVYFKISQPESFVQLLPTLSVFTMAALQILISASSLGERIMEIVALQPDLEIVHQALTRRDFMVTEGTVTLDRFSSEIVFENVSLEFDRGKHPVLKDLNLTISKGETVGIVGNSGSGKTTILNLILGFYEPTSGRILIDGHDLKSLHWVNWLSKIGFVSQDPFMYHASAFDVIKFGRESFSADDVISASKTANAHDFIMSLPNGYQTIVGERGMKLSGGQQQRLAIARAILANPDILIFDEATSALDHESEALIQDALNKISRDKTVIIVAHRLSALRHVNKTYEIAKGSSKELVSGGNV